MVELKAVPDSTDSSEMEMSPSGIAVHLVKSFTLDSSGEPQSLEDDEGDNEDKPEAGPSFDLSLLFFLAVPLCCDNVVTSLCWYYVIYVDIMLIYVDLLYKFFYIIFIFFVQEH